jgi:hypothetical protein
VFSLHSTAAQLIYISNFKIIIVVFLLLSYLRTLSASIVASDSMIHSPSF